MLTESQKDLTQNRYLCHRVSDTLDTTAMQNPKGNLNVFLAQSPSFACIRVLSKGWPRLPPSG